MSKEELIDGYFIDKVFGTNTRELVVLCNELYAGRTGIIRTGNFEVYTYAPEDRNVPENWNRIISDITEYNRGPNRDQNWHTRIFPTLQNGCHEQIVDLIVNSFNYDNFDLIERDITETNHIQALFKAREKLDG